MQQVPWSLLARKGRRRPRHDGSGMARMACDSRLGWARHLGTMSSSMKFHPGCERAHGRYVAITIHLEETRRRRRRSGQALLGGRRAQAAEPPRPRQDHARGGGVGSRTKLTAERSRRTAVDRTTNCSPMPVPIASTTQNASRAGRQPHTHRVHSTYRRY